MSAVNGDSKGIAPNIDVKSLSYAFPDGSSGLKDVTINLPPGSRTLLIGGPLSSHLINKTYSPNYLPKPMARAKPRSYVSFLASGLLPPGRSLLPESTPSRMVSKV